MSELAAQILDGDRRALARGITLVESTRDDHQAEADDLLTEVMARTGGATRVGISGAPGVGKSTLIEALGLYLIDKSHRVAVLAVDPSSPLGGGSILGDKTRMGELTRRTEAFVRPSPTAGTLGGVARRTREAMLLCEAAGFDIVLVETVGVGQSEVAVEAMVDCFLLLVAPGGGDELQGIKRGIMELADLVVVNKADGDLEAIAGTTAADYANALRLVRPKTTAWEPQVVRCSALEGAASTTCGTASKHITTRSRRRVTSSGDGPISRASGCGRSSRPRCWTACGTTRPPLRLRNASKPRSPPASCQRPSPPSRSSERSPTRTIGHSPKTHLATRRSR